MDTNKKLPLYVFDIDRTLKPLIGPIPYFTKKAVRILVKNNNVAIATGRCFEEALDLAQSLNVVYMITSGGSEVYQYGKRIYQYSHTCKEELSNLKRENPIHLICTDFGIYSSNFPKWISIFSFGHIFFSKKSSIHHFLKMLHNVQIKDVPNGANVRKIYIFSKYEGTLLYRHLFGNLKSYEFEDKALGIKVLKKNLDAGQIICFGDSRNDLTLFKIADESYAMKHGSRALKAVSTKIIGFHLGIYRVVCKKV